MIPSTVHFSRPLAGVMSSGSIRTMMIAPLAFSDCSSAPSSSG